MASLASYVEELGATPIRRIILEGSFSLSTTSGQFRKAAETLAKIFAYSAPLAITLDQILFPQAKRQ
jgi:hypothetical protein